MKYFDKSIREVCDSNVEILRTIYCNMIKTRQEGVPEYRPYTHNKYITPDIYRPGIDFKNIFDDFDEGDYAFVTYNWEGPFEKKMIHNIYNYSDVELYYNGEKKEQYPAVNNSLDADVFVKKVEITS